MPVMNDHCCVTQTGLTVRFSASLVLTKFPTNYLFKSQGFVGTWKCLRRSCLRIWRISYIFKTTIADLWPFFNQVSQPVPKKLVKNIICSSSFLQLRWAVIHDDKVKQVCSDYYYYYYYQVISNKSVLLIDCGVLALFTQWCFLGIAKTLVALLAVHLHEKGVHISLKRNNMKTCSRDPFCSVVFSFAA